MLFMARSFAHVLFLVEWEVHFVRLTFPSLEEGRRASIGDYSLKTIHLLSNS